MLRRATIQHIAQVETTDNRWDSTADGPAPDVILQPVIMAFRAVIGSDLYGPGVGK